MYSQLIYFSEERARTPSPTAPGPDRHCRYVISPATRAPPPEIPRCKARRTAESTGVYRRPVQNRAGGHRAAVKPYASDRRQRWPPRQQQQPVEPEELVAPAVPERLPEVPAERPVMAPPGPASERAAEVEAAAAVERPTAPPAATITAARAPAAERRNGRQLAVISSDRTL